MTKEEASNRLKQWIRNGCDGMTDERLGYIEGWFHKSDKEAFEQAIKALEQEPSGIFDEYGNYKYPSDVELTEPNTATSMPSGDLISRHAVLDIVNNPLNIRLDEIIKKLPSAKQEPFINKPCVSSEVCEHDKNKMLDKIRTEIKAMFPPSGSWMYEEGHEVEHTVCEVLADVLQIIDKYREVGE